MDENNLVDDSKINEIISKINGMIKEINNIENQQLQKNKNKNNNNNNNLQKNTIINDKEWYNKNMPWAYQNL